MSHAAEPPESRPPADPSPIAEKDALSTSSPLAEKDAFPASAATLGRATASSVTDSGEDDEDHTLRKRPWHPRVTPWSAILAHEYKGAGTEAEPYIVSWLADDPENPMGYKQSYKWFITVMAATGTLAVSMGSSMLSAAVEDIKKDFPGHNTMLYIMVTGKFLSSPGFPDTRDRVRILLSNREQSSETADIPETDPHRHLRSRFRRRSPAVGAMQRGVRPPRHVHLYICAVYGIQRGRVWREEHQRAARHAVLRGNIWLLDDDELGRHHRGHVRGAPARSGYGRGEYDPHELTSLTKVLCYPVSRSCDRPHCWWLPLGGVELALGRRRDCTVCCSPDCD